MGSRRLSGHDEATFICADCVLPFTFDGTTYPNGCTREGDPDNRTWCPTAVNSNEEYIAGSGEWGHCASSCQEDEVPYGPYGAYGPGPNELCEPYPDEIRSDPEKFKEHLENGGNPETFVGEIIKLQKCEKC